MLENFFLIILYHTIVHDNDVKIKDFIDVTSLINSVSSADTCIKF